MKCEKTQAHTNLFQYDDYGASGMMTVPNANDSVYYANVFTAETSQWVTSVMVYGSESAYDVSVYTGVLNKKSPISGTLATTEHGTFEKSGYHTILLSTPVFVQAGTTFSIVAKTKGQYVPCEQASHTEWTNADGSTHISDTPFNLELLNRDFAENQSFFSADGTEWKDMYSVSEEKYTYNANGTESATTMKYGNVSLKAITQDAGIVNFSTTNHLLKAGTPIALTTFDNVDIYYSLNGADYVKYETPIVFSGDMTITAYADMPDGLNTSTTMRFQEAEPAISSLLCIDGNQSEYAVVTDEKNTLHCYTNAGTRKISIMPIFKGTMSCNGESISSGDIVDISVLGGMDSIELQVENNGLTATYTLDIEETGDSERDEFAVGDVDKSGTVDAVDASLILIYSAEIGSGAVPDYADTDWKNRADFNRVNNVNASDAALVLAYAAQQGAGN